MASEIRALIDARAVGDAVAVHRGRAEQLRRLRALRPALARRSLGVAFVTTADERAGQQRRARAAGRMLGCPVEVFDDGARALAWLRERGDDTGPIVAGSA